MTDSAMDAEVRLDRGSEATSIPAGLGRAPNALSNIVRWFAPESTDKREMERPWNNPLLHCRAACEPLAPVDMNWCWKEAFHAPLHQDKAAVVARLAFRTDRDEQAETMMARVLKASRYLILLPIIGLTVAASFFFVFGGIDLFRLLIEILQHLHAGGKTKNQIIFEVVEYVHTFLIGTVLYITAIGLYQLFIGKIDFVGWLQIDSTEDLETSLIGVTVVVLAVNFMGEIIAGGSEGLLQYGAGIALVITALGVFVGLRTWATTIAKAANKAGESEKKVGG